MTHRNAVSFRDGPHIKIRTIHNRETGAGPARLYECVYIKRSAEIVYIISRDNIPTTLIHWPDLIYFNQKCWK